MRHWPRKTLTTLLHRALVRLGEPARIGDIVREAGDEAITPALARRQMETQPRRFAAVDRRWDITSRYLDKTKPLRADAGRSHLHLRRTDPRPTTLLGSWPRSQAACQRGIHRSRRPAAARDAVLSHRRRPRVWPALLAAGYDVGARRRYTFL